MDKVDVDVRKNVSKYKHESQRKAKRSKCILCGKGISSLCNSHSIPRFILDNIAEEGKVVNGAYALGLDYVNQEDGINRSGVFFLMCNECDNAYFSDYESEEALLREPSNRIMAEIAMKNTLQQIAKRHIEIELSALLQKKRNVYANKEVLDTINSLDVRDYVFDLKRAKKIIDKKLKSGYILTYTTILPYVVPIAAQACITLIRDLYKNIINDIFDLSEDVRMEFIHCCIYPLANATRIILFHHKDDRKYVIFDRQFALLSEEEKIKHINYMFFQYSENYFSSPQIKEVLATNDSLKTLCAEYNEAPNLGVTKDVELFDKYESVPINDVPNLLSEQYKLR